MSEDILIVPCPTCQKAVKWQTENAYRPFCSKRCQLIDLGEWAAEEKAIAGDSTGLVIENVD